MDKTEHSVIAVDLGASSGRVIQTTLKEGRICLSERHRFSNIGISAMGRQYTDILYIYSEIIKGLQNVFRGGEGIDSVGIDAWGVDFVFLDSQGELVGNAYHYRDSQAAGMMERAAVNFGKGGLFQMTGVQDMWYNTVFQLMGIAARNPGRLQQAECFLMIADMISYLLTGNRNLEYTGVSTTQMYNMRYKRWENSILKRLNVEKSLFPEVLMTGEIKGYLSPQAANLAGAGIDARIPVIAAAQHDSACAAYAVPSEDPNYIFINSGTWSVIGSILDEPVITEEVYEKNFSNEGAAFGKIKLVKSIMGMWLIQELRRVWEKQGKNCEYDYLLREAEQAPAFSHMIDVEDELFVSPDNMEDAIHQYCEKTGQGRIHTQGEFYRTVVESLAFQYRKAVEDIESLTGKTADVLYFLGGAVKDQMFCQFIADASGKVVSAGPVEATAVGNALIQFRALGVVESERENGEILRKSFEIKRYLPRDTKIWTQMYAKYQNMLTK